ncbi:MAG TPA: hypothetical protein P5120_18060 [Spirochaetota bacterium]|nr:hypothetical protein [Spirochaetota bacterium]
MTRSFLYPVMPVSLKGNIGISKSEYRNMKYEIPAFRLLPQTQHKSFQPV